jgi:hypothetical protein
MKINEEKFLLFTDAEKTGAYSRIPYREYCAKAAVTFILSIVEKKSTTIPTILPPSSIYQQTNP